MTNRSSETKQEVFEYAWASKPELETSPREEAFSFYWSSNSLPGLEPKAKDKAFSYSWSSPDPEESMAVSNAGALQVSPGEAEVQRVEPSPGVMQNIADRVFGDGLPGFRVVGVIGWSAIAGSGAIVALADAGPSVAAQLGSIGGLWLGVSAAIWFLPRVIRKRTENHVPEGGARSVIG